MTRVATARQTRMTIAIGSHALTDITTPASQQTTEPARSRGDLVTTARDMAQAWLGQRSFSRDAVTSFALSIFSAAVGLITTLILARLIGAANYGIYATAIVYANVLAFVACLGFPQLIVRSEARGADRAAAQVLSSVRRTAMWSAILFGGSLAGIAWLVRDWIMPASSEASAWAFALAMVMVVPMAIQRLNEGTLLGRHRPVWSVIPERFVRPIAMFVVVIGLAFTLGDGIGAHYGIGAQALAYCISFAVALHLVAKTRAEATTASGVVDPTILKDALPFFFVGLTTLLASRVDIMMLAALTDATTVGQYRLAYQISGLVLMLSMVSQAVLSPKIAQQADNGTITNVTKHIPKLSLALLACGALLSVSVYVALQVALPWIGSDFEKAGPILAILLLAFCVVAALSPALPMLTMTGRAKYAALANLISIAVNVGLNLLLIPAFGGKGAAIATAISLTLLYSLYALFSQHCRQ